MTVPATMMALRAHARGGAEQLVFEQAPVPVPGPGEALVEVHAAGITFAELTWDESWTTVLTFRCAKPDPRFAREAARAHESFGLKGRLRSRRLGPG